MDFKERYQYNSKTDLLGKGGFATVYKAGDKLLNRVVALKFFSVSDDKHTLIAEISRVIGLEHANLCRYYDAALLDMANIHGDVDKVEVGVMEYLDGGDLKSYCQRHPNQQQKLLTDVLKGLSFLHKRGIIHRDLKPANILIKNTEDGPVAKITDFGISKDVGGSHTSSSLLMGTIEYMAPEQFSPAKYGIGGKIGTNLDLWSFGLMVYEMVTGHSLFGSRGGDSSAEQVMGNILNDELIEDKISGLSEPYLSLVRKCLVKDAKQRVQGADELISLLEGKTYASPAPTIQETVVLPKLSDEGWSTAETIAITKDKETVALPQALPVGAKMKNKTKTKNVILLSIFLVAIIFGGYLTYIHVKQSKSIEREKKLAEERDTILQHISKNMAEVLGGSMELGGQTSSYGSSIRTVNIQSFAINKYEVTQAEWRAIMVGNNPSKSPECMTCPVNNVTIDSVKIFLKRLNELTGKQYRLPTDDEWEYAAKGGIKSKGNTYAGTNDLDLCAWTRSNSAGNVHPVGKKLPNELGIYDMLGNAQEYCDFNTGEFGDDVSDYINLRGGDYSTDPSGVLIFRRGSLPKQNFNTDGSGFRLAHSVEVKVSKKLDFIDKKPRKHKLTQKGMQDTSKSLFERLFGAPEKDTGRGQSITDTAKKTHTN